MLFRSKDRAKNSASKRGGGGEEKKETSFPSPSSRYGSRSIFRAAKPKIPLRGLSWLRNQTETLTTQAQYISPSGDGCTERKGPVSSRPRFTTLSGPSTPFVRCYFKTFNGINSFCLGCIKKRLLLHW